MKEEDVPQDLSSLGKITRELCYATDKSGKYVSQLSLGWEVKIGALDLAWQDIASRVEEARKKVEASEFSPVLFFMEYRLMDLDVLAGYTGFWKWQIKRHLKTSVFKHLSQQKLSRYARAFNVSLDALKTMNVDNEL